MNLKKIYLTVGLSALLASGCGGGGGGGGGTVTPTLPSNATAITAVNATDIAYSTIDTYQTITDMVTAAETTNLPNANVAINLIKQYAFNKNRNAPQIATGVTDTYACDTGSITDTYTNTDTSASGSVTFNSCNFAGVVFTGSARYSSSWSLVNDNYTDTANGRITMSVQGSSFTIALDYAETGDSYTGDYVIDLDFSLSGPGIGILVSTTTPITGNMYSYVTGGVVTVTGANHSSVALEIVNSNTVDIWLDENGDGTYTYHDTLTVIL